MREVKRRRKGPKLEGILAELYSLVEMITADGKITDEETAWLQRWMEDNAQLDLPSVTFLRQVLAGVLADGKLTPEERRAIYRAVEKILPTDLRAGARSRREAVELLEKTQRAEEKEKLRLEKQAKREEKLRNSPIEAVDCLVAGVAYEGRSEVVTRYVRPGCLFYFVREPQNPYDPNAVAIIVNEGYSIGYLPREVAEKIAPLLDQGCKYVAHCKRIYEGKHQNIPVLLARIYRPEASVAGIVGLSEGPQRREWVGESVNARKSKGAPCGCLLVVLVLLFSIALGMIFMP